MIMQCHSNYINFLLFDFFMDSKEEKIRKITLLYYSKPEIKKVIFEFSKNREICPRYFEDFGKRPDSFQYPNDVFELVKKGATSFHCSEEIWQDPLKLSTLMNQNQINQLRIGWDLLIDIDCKYFDFSKKAAIAVINVLKKEGIKNIGIKYSGSKGFHIIIPWIAFPKTLAGIETKNLFPELPRKIISYIRFKAEEEMGNLISEDELKQFDKTKIQKGIKCNKCREIVNEYKLLKYFCRKCKREELKKTTGEKKESRCPECYSIFELKNEKNIYECKKCGISSEKNPESFSSNKIVYEKNSEDFFEKNPENFSKHTELDLFGLMGLDLVLVSPRHLFRMPYSLHEKTALASVVIYENEIQNFEPKDADPLKIKVRDFLPESKEGEATELFIQASDWYRQEVEPQNASARKQNKEDFKPIKLNNLSDSFFPPSVQKILLGLDDGKKRALFILINLFRSISMEREELEKRIFDWNKKNKIPLKDGYIKTQIIWSYRNKIILPPNFDKDYYKAIGIVPTDEELRLRNPINYILKKSNKTKDNFKK